jgi:hypothetical protein
MGSSCRDDRSQSICHLVPTHSFQKKNKSNVTLLSFPGREGEVGRRGRKEGAREGWIGREKQGKDERKEGEGGTVN